jgi:hypothetical protein
MPLLAKPDDTAATANETAVLRIAEATPVFGRPVEARAAIGLADGELGHAGPPFDAGQTPPPTVLNALAGACIHEGWAKTFDEGRSMVRAGEIRLRANHEIGVVSPMAGIVRPSQTLFRIDNRAGGPPGYATLAEKGRRVLRFGAYGPDVAAQLSFVENEVAEALDTAISRVSSTSASTPTSRKMAPILWSRGCGAGRPARPSCVPSPTSSTSSTFLR